MTAALLALAALVAFGAVVQAVLERAAGRAIEREFRKHLRGELEASRIRVAQVELMLDARRANELELMSPQDRDAHLVVSAPALAAPGRATSTAAPASLGMSIDRLPEILRAEVRAIDGDENQREYLETIQEQLANGADPVELHSRLFGD